MFRCLVGLLVAVLWYAPPVEPIFTDNVTILSVEVVEQWREITYPVVDNHFLILPDTTQYRLPKGIQNLSFPLKQPLNSLWYFVAYDAQTQKHAWSLNSVTGEFTRYETLMIETACGSFDLTQITMLWGFSTQPGGTYLCHYERGIVGNALSDTYSWSGWSLHESTPLIFESPTGDYVLFVGRYESDENIRSYDTFLYHTVTDELVSLGAVIFPQSFSQMFWADATTAVYYIYEMGNQFSYHESFSVMYLQDHTVIRVNPPPNPEAIYEAEYRENPPRIDRFFNEDDYCVREIYDVLSRTTTLYDMQNVCYPEEISQYPEKIYYRDRENGLVRYNAITGEHTTLFQDDVEMVYAVSQDETYAILVLDEDGKFTHEPWQVFEAPALYNARLALVDIVVDGELYSLPINFYNWPGSVSTSATYFLADDTSQTILSTDTYVQLSYHEEENREVVLLHLQEDALEIYEIPGLLVDKFDNGWWSLLQRRVYEGPFKVDLYNPITGQIVPLVDTPERFSRWELEFVENNVFRFTIYSDSYPRNHHTVYTVQVAGIE